MAKAKTPNAASVASPEVLDTSVDTTVEAPAPKRKGRPPGSKNKPKAKVAKAGKQRVSTAETPVHIPLEDLPLPALRLRARTIYNVPVTEDMDREDILAGIRKMERGNKDFALAAPESGAILPGWAKIEIFKDTSPKASNRPHYVAVNGYKVTIPLGIPVLVPIKIYEVLNNAVEQAVEEDQSTNASVNSSYRTSTRHRIPFRLHGMVDGPDPRPKNQRERVAKSAPREEYAHRFGRYPTNAMLLEAVKDGVIKLIR